MNFTYSWHASHKAVTAVTAVKTVTATAAIITLLICGSGREAYAQNQPPRLSLLKTGLDNAVWDPAQRGPLIAVAPQTVRPAPVSEKGGPQTGREPERLPGGRYRVAELAAFFGRRVVPLRGISVLAPTEMAVFNAKPGKPDYLAGLPQFVKMRMLQATLTPAQWKLLGSDAGLGAGDLSREQRALFFSYLPETIAFRRQKATVEGSLSPVASSRAVVVPDSRRSGVRLRVSRSAQFGVPFQGESDSFFRYNVNPLPAGAEVAVLDSDSVVSDKDDETGTTLYGQLIRSFQPNRLKPQQIDFAAPALQARVSLGGVKTVGDLIERVRTATRTEIYVDGRAAKLALWVRAGEAQTVPAGSALQALCWSLAGAIRYVGAPGDPDSRRDGVFILTQDLEGIGSRLTRIRDWFLTARGNSAQQQERLIKSIQQHEPLQYLGFAPDDPFALNEKTNRIAEEARNSFRGRMDGATVMLSDLPPSQQNAIRSAMVSYDRNKPVPGAGQKELVSNGSVRVFLGVRTSLLVPGVGEVRMSSGGWQSGDISALTRPADKDEPSDPDPVPLPEPADVARIPHGLALGGVLCVSPTTEEEAKRVVQAARNRGLKQVWLVLPVLPLADGTDDAIAKSRALLAAAISEAGREKPVLQVLAGVRLFPLPPVADSASPRAARDITITGELPGEMAQRRTANALAAEADPALFGYGGRNVPNWAAPGAGGTEAMARRLSRALAKIAETPALGGMVLLDTAPPGYSVAAGTTVNDTLGNHIEVGYRPDARIAFIRSAGYDPIDLIPGRNSSSSNLSVPFFEEDDRLQSEQWNRFRTGVVSEALSKTYGFLRSSKGVTGGTDGTGGGFPIYLQNLDAVTPGSSAGLDWFSRWDKAEALPRRSPKRPRKPWNIFGDAQAVSAVSLLNIPFPNLPAASDLPRAEAVAPSVGYARSMNTLLPLPKGSWAGVVLNLSEVPVEEALTVLEGINSPPQ